HQFPNFYPSLCCDSRHPPTWNVSAGACSLAGDSLVSLDESASLPGVVRGACGLSFCNHASLSRTAAAAGSSFYRDTASRAVAVVEYVPLVQLVDRSRAHHACCRPSTANRNALVGVGAQPRDWNPACGVVLFELHYAALHPGSGHGYAAALQIRGPQ